MDITAFGAIQGHRFWYQSKTYILLVINTNLTPIFRPFQAMAN